MDFALLRDAFWGLTFDGIALGAIYALISLGYTLVYGVLRLINFAHSEVFMIGTFAALVTASGIMGVKVEDDPRTGGSMILTLVVCLVVAMLASAITAVLVEIIAYRRLRQRGATKLATLISAIGVSKGATLSKMAARHGLAADDCVSFGDNPNDFSMLEWCGRSFAMADGHPDGPKYAKGVAGPCEEDGVAIVIEQLLELPA